MQKADSNSSAGTNVDSSTKVEDLQSSSHDTKPNVSGLPLSDPKKELYGIKKLFLEKTNEWRIKNLVGGSGLTLLNHSIGDTINIGFAIDYSKLKPTS